MALDVKSKNTVAEQLLKEFVLLFCSLMVTTIFTILNLLADIVSDQVNLGFLNGTINVDECVELVMTYTKETLGMGSFLLNVFLVFFIVTSATHIALFCFEKWEYKNQVRKRRYYSHLVNISKKRIEILEIEEKKRNEMERNAECCNTFHDSVDD